MTAISDQDRERVLRLLDDMGVIGDVLKALLPTPATITAVLVPILRRWIVEDGFFLAQKVILPAKVEFHVAINEDAERLCQLGYFEHWMAVVLAGTIGVGASQVAQDWIGKPTPGRGGEFRQLPHTPKQFFDQKMFFWQGRFYTRRDVIRMHANKLGGVHLDFERDDDEAHIDQIKNYFGFEKEPVVFNMLKGDKIALARADPKRRKGVYDATELVTFDTARIFAKGIESSATLFEALLR